MTSGFSPSCCRPLAGVSLLPLSLLASPLRWAVWDGAWEAEGEPRLIAVWGMESVSLQSSNGEEASGAAVREVLVHLCIATSEWELYPHDTAVCLGGRGVFPVYWCGVGCPYGCAELQGRSVCVVHGPAAHDSPGASCMKCRC